MLALSVDPSSESAKMDSLLKGAFPLLGDADMRVASSYGMVVPMGSQPMSAMGYAIIDSAGKLRYLEIDPLFGDHTARILKQMKEGTP